MFPIYYIIRSRLLFVCWLCWCCDVCFDALAGPLDWRFYVWAFGVIIWFPNWQLCVVLLGAKRSLGWRWRCLQWMSGGLSRIELMIILALDDSGLPLRIESDYFLVQRKQSLLIRSISLGAVAAAASVAQPTAADATMDDDVGGGCTAAAAWSNSYILWPRNRTIHNRGGVVFVLQLHQCNRSSGLVSKPLDWCHWSTAPYNNQWLTCSGVSRSVHIDVAQHLPVPHSFLPKYSLADK